MALFLIVAICLFVFRGNASHAFNDALRSITASHHKLIIRTSHGNGVVVAVHMIDFLIGTGVASCFIVRKTMGESNGIDKGSHGQKKEAVRRLPPHRTIVNGLGLDFFFVRGSLCYAGHPLAWSFWAWKQ